MFEKPSCSEEPAPACPHPLCRRRARPASAQTSCVACVWACAYVRSSCMSEPSLPEPDLQAYIYTYIYMCLYVTHVGVRQKKRHARTCNFVSPLYALDAYTHTHLPNDVQGRVSHLQRFDTLLPIWTISLDMLVPSQSQRAQRWEDCWAFT